MVTVQRIFNCSWRKNSDSWGYLLRFGLFNIFSFKKMTLAMRRRQMDQIGGGMSRRKREKSQ